MAGHEPASEEITGPTPRPGRDGRRTILFFFALGFVLFVFTAWALIFQPAPLSIVQQAKLLLRAYKSDKLDGDWKVLLARPEMYYVPSMNLPLVGKPAPDFRLNDWQGRSVHLRSLIEEGPVVLIFYYGYWCDHCVVQLFDVDEDLKYFKEIGARVVAVSSDPPEETAAKFKQFGPFHFDVLSDPNNEVAQKYGCYRPAEGKQNELMAHGTFIIDRNGIIRWADTGDKPFRSNKTLLLELAALEEKLPEGISPPRQTKE